MSNIWLLTSDEHLSGWSWFTCERQYQQSIHLDHIPEQVDRVDRRKIMKIFEEWNGATFSEVRSEWLTLVNGQTSISIRQDHIPEQIKRMNCCKLMKNSKESSEAIFKEVRPKLMTELYTWISTINSSVSHSRTNTSSISA